jgi:hypothetical protein
MEGGQTLHTRGVHAQLRVEEVFSQDRDFELVLILVLQTTENLVLGLLKERRLGTAMHNHVQVRDIVIFSCMYVVFHISLAFLHVLTQYIGSKILWPLQIMSDSIPLNRSHSRMVRATVQRADNP